MLVKSHELSSHQLEKISSDFRLVRKEDGNTLTNVVSLQNAEHIKLSTTDSLIQMSMSMSMSISM